MLILTDTPVSRSYRQPRNRRPAHVVAPRQFLERRALGPPPRFFLPMRGELDRPVTKEINLSLSTPFRKYDDALSISIPRLQPQIRAL